jgi:hypothetical protein
MMQADHKDKERTNQTTRLALPDIRRAYGQDEVSRRKFLEIASAGIIGRPSMAFSLSAPHEPNS